ncbi:MAG: hypothetical protein O9345_14640 [Burkholderiaceae bacterium]|nr:hypothetical protein [Burkholderiales bacterium]MCZ8101161.1 hypothetical protein [Burkholderiales bacterium]MCZ8339362.1 hypothetical protein [Burkholderiaceae bacterium]
MDHVRSFRLAFGCTLVPPGLAACGERVDPDAAASNQAALDAVTTPTRAPASW